MIDRTSPLPLYYQLKQIVLQKIESAEWTPGDVIPTELDFQEQYGLSRTTVRQTLSELVNEGRLVRQRGKGTFVAPPKFAHDPAGRQALSDYMKAQGLTPGWQVLDAGWIVATNEIAQPLGVPAGANLFRLRRLRLANSEAIGYHIAYTPEFMAEQINQGAFETGGSLQYMEHIAQMHKSQAQRTIEAIGARKELATLLGCPAGTPLLRITRLITATDGTLLEYLQASYLGDRFTYQITI